MNAKKLREIWDEISAIEVPLKADVTMGPKYFIDQIVVCRHAQNRVTNLEGDVQRAKSMLLMRLGAAAFVESEPVGRAKTARLRRKLDALNCLLETLKAVQANLGRTAKDLQL